MSSLVCDSLDINDRELIRLANHHPRVNILQTGCGVGGTVLLLTLGLPQHPIAPLIQAARRVNDRKSRWVIDRYKILLCL